MNENGPPSKADYYNSGSSEPAETSELVLNRLEAVRRAWVLEKDGSWIFSHNSFLVAHREENLLRIPLV